MIIWNGLSGSVKLQGKEMLADIRYSEKSYHHTYQI